LNVQPGSVRSRLEVVDLLETGLKGNVA